MILYNWTLPHVIYTQYLGVVTGADLVESALSASGDLRFDDIKLIIGDWTKVERTDIHAKDVKTLMACLGAIAKICPRAKNGTIVRRNETGLALSSWYALLGESLPWQIDTFDCCDTAFKFYGINKADLKLDN